MVFLSYFIILDLVSTSLLFLSFYSSRTIRLDWSLSWFCFSSNKRLFDSYSCNRSFLQISSLSRMFILAISLLLESYCLKASHYLLSWSIWAVCLLRVTFSSVFYFVMVMILFIISFNSFLLWVYLVCRLRRSFKSSIYISLLFTIWVWED